MTSPPRYQRPTNRERWAPTQAHGRALSLTVLVLLAAIIVQRPDAIVLISPILVVLVWSVLTRPSGTPEAELRVGSSVVTEGQSSPAQVRIEGAEGADLAAASLAAIRWIRYRPEHGNSVVAVPRSVREQGEDPPSGTGEPAEPILIGFDTTPLRWGKRQVGPGLAALIGPFGAYRWGPTALQTQLVKVTPAAIAFDNAAPAPHPRGLVGLHRSARPGDASEFRSIRPFQWGDRLKRIHWARSLRAGELHVTSSYAEEDTHIAIIVDAFHDLGRSEGHTGTEPGTASTLDHSVRAAAAIAGHFLHHGDRVSLHTWTSRNPTRLPPRTGKAHHHRIRETLATTTAGATERPSNRYRWNLPPGTLVVIISPLISPTAITEAGILASTGAPVVIIDAMIEGIDPGLDHDKPSALAWRLRMLERTREVDRIAAHGVPVVPWHGPGSLDTILRQLAHTTPRRSS